LMLQLHNEASGQKTTNMAQIPLPKWMDPVRIPVFQGVFNDDWGDWSSKIWIESVQLVWVFVIQRPSGGHRLIGDFVGSVFFPRSLDISGGNEGSTHQWTFVQLGRNLNCVSL
jgi:hypothetical protein